MDWILSIIGQAFALFKPVTDFAKESPGAGFLVAGIIASVTVMLRSLPAAIWNFVVHQSTTTIEFDNSPFTGDRAAFQRFNKWFIENRVKWMSRSTRVFFDWKASKHDPNEFVRNPTISPFNSKHLVFWEGRPCFVTVRREGDGTIVNADTPFAAKITRLGRSMDSLVRMVEHFSHSESVVYPYRRALNAAAWEVRSAIRFRPIATVATNDDLVNRIIAIIEDFQTKEEWYVSRGIPYKLCICLYGPPGTGKNSIVRAVASALRRGLDCININETTDALMQKAIMDQQNRSMVLFDDFDCKQFNTRQPGKEAALVSDSPNAAPTIEEAPKKEAQADFLSVSLGGFLSVLDGESTPHGRIFFLNTNHFDSLDEAITRPGRINHAFLVDFLRDEAIKSYLTYQFSLDGEVPQFDGITFAPISGATLEQVYKENWQSLPDIIDILEKVQ